MFSYERLLKMSLWLRILEFFEMACWGQSSYTEQQIGLDGGAAQKRSLQFFTNRPLRWEWPAWLLSHPFEGDFDIAPKLRGFFSNFDSYRVAASYIDETGAAILSKALERGAHIELVMPWTPNVYADCNARKDDVGWGWMGYKNTLKTKSQ